MEMRYWLERRSLSSFEQRRLSERKHWGSQVDQSSDISAPGKMLDDMLARQDFQHFVHELNVAVTSIGETVEGNIYFNNEINLAGSQIDRTYAHHREGFIPAITGRDRLLEIGFNAGHSALTYILANPRGCYVGVDLAYRPYTKVAYQWLRDRFGERVKLYVGDSTVVLPQIQNEIGNFDAVHVDGGHDFRCAYLDIWNTYKRLTHGGVMIVDDMPVPDITTAVEYSLMTRLLEYHELHSTFAHTFQAFIKKVPID